MGGAPLGPSSVSSPGAKTYAGAWGQGTARARDLNLSEEECLTHTSRAWNGLCRGKGGNVWASRVSHSCPDTSRTFRKPRGALQASHSPMLPLLHRKMAVG